MTSFLQNRKLFNLENMKPFNLEEYLKNPSKKIITKNGNKVRIICIDRKSERFNVIALIDYGNTEGIESYTIDGRAHSCGESWIDLFFAPEKKEGWATIYGKFLTGEIFFTKEEAEELVKRYGTKDFVSIAKIEWEE